MNILATWGKRDADHFKTITEKIHWKDGMLKAQENKPIFIVFNVNLRMNLVF